MDRLRFTCLMIFYWLTLVSIYGKEKDLFPSCEIVLMVQRHTTWKTPPQRSVTVGCPVKHCGESVTVTWCKVLKMHHCEWINGSENVEIIQNYSKNELISYLTFKRISINDDGLYRCGLKEYKNNIISHTINISVSDLNKEVERTDRQQSDNTAAESQTSPAHLESSWLPYLYICFSIAFVIAALTVLTHLCFHGQKRMTYYKTTNGQESILFFLLHLSPVRLGLFLKILN
ncbi:B- and T-lymphocyte attenuator isoform X2 [Anabas testudineus]|uniref:B- and T-lymphocyte attenuator isoform X2 n=1 Tax=Anabas testudineus TaxID=64144 RepID=UPI000E46187A|nr:B- and T-lymphocyte attenuator isoform X2 [Anabas testudineus]